MPMSLFSSYETGSHYVGQAELKLTLYLLSAQIMATRTFSFFF